MTPAVGQLWQDDNGDILFITDVGDFDDRLKVIGVAFIAGVRCDYTTYSLPEAFDFGTAMFNPPRQIDD